MKKIIIVLFVFLFMDCTKEDDSKNEDYRNAYTGSFNFTTVKNTIVMCYDSSATCIDGWHEYQIDTSYLSSIVEKKDSNKLIIKFGNGIIYQYNNDSVYGQTIDPIISLNVTMSLPDYLKGGHN